MASFLGPYASPRGFLCEIFRKARAGDNPAGHRADFPVHGLPVGQRRFAAKAGIGRAHQPVEMGIAAISLVTHVCLALITPTIWALVLGSVVTSAVALVASYLIIPGVRHRFIIDRASAREIMGFGKWIFLSSMIYFLAMNFDRLYFAKQIALDDARRLRHRAVDGRHAEQFRHRTSTGHGPFPACGGDAGVGTGSAGETASFPTHYAAARRHRAWPASWPYPT